MLFILLITEIILLIFSYIITGRDIMRPSVIMIGMFILSTFVALLNSTAWNIDYSFKTYSIITIGLLIASLTDIFVYVTHKKKRICEGRDIKELKISWKFTIILIGIELVTLLLYYGEIKRLAYLDGYVQGANLLWHFRNITSYTVQEGVSGKISLLLKIIDAAAYVYSYIIINNILARKNYKKNFFLCIIPIGIFTIKVLMGSGRQDLLRLGAFIVVVGYIINKYKKGWNYNISLKYLKKAIVIIPIVLLLFYYASSIIGRGTTRTIFQYISTYTGGSIQHFNQYVEKPYLYNTRHFGEETFPAVYTTLKKIGITDYTRPVHLEMRKLGITQGNVYTFFRRPYSDFGLLGVILITFIVIWLFSVKYSSYRNKDDSYKNDFSIICYGYLFYWIVLSSIEQYSIGIVSIGTIITILFMYFIFAFATRVKYNNGILRIYKTKGDSYE